MLISYVFRSLFQRRKRRDFGQRRGGIMVAAHQKLPPQKSCTELIVNSKVCDIIRFSSSHCYSFEFTVLLGWNISILCKCFPFLWNEKVDIKRPQTSDLCYPVGLPFSCSQIKITFFKRLFLGTSFFCHSNWCFFFWLLTGNFSVCYVYAMLLLQLNFLYKL